MMVRQRQTAALTCIELRQHNLCMHPVSRVVVLMLVVGLAVLSYCAQACAMPQITGPECPEHHQSQHTDCCKHAATDATRTERLLSAPEFKSSTLLFAPVPVVSTACLIDCEMSLHRKFKPLDSVSQHS